MRAWAARSARLGRLVEADAQGSRPSRHVQELGLQETDEATQTAVLDEFEPVPAPPAPTSSAMIVFENVTKIYEPDVVALRDVSFAIDKGEFVFIVGASGSGKSTIVRLRAEGARADRRAGSSSAAATSARLKRKKVPLLRRNIGCVFQDFKLLPNRTAAENVAYALKVQGESSTSIRRKVPEVLNLVGLAHKMSSLPDELSGGEQQRVSIARAFVNHPPLLICDEPTGNLDPDTSRRDHAAPLPDQPLRDDDPDGDARPRDGRQDAQARDRARGRTARPRRAPRRLHLRVMSRFKLIIAEAVRSLGANLSTTFAATMTVLIGMFLLGLFIGLGSWALSLERPRTRSSCSSRSTSAPDATRCGQSRGDAGADERRARPADGDPAGQELSFVSKEEALRIDEEAASRAARRT